MDVAAIEDLNEIMVLKLTELSEDIDASAEGEDNLGHYR
jgi:hypothetical protein